MNLKEDIKKLDNALDDYVLACDTLLATIKAKKISVTKLALLSGLSSSTLFDRIRDYKMTPWMWRNVIRSIHEIENSKN